MYLFEVLSKLMLLYIYMYLAHFFFFLDSDPI